MTAIIHLDGDFPRIPDVYNGFSARAHQVQALERACYHLYADQSISYPGPCMSTGLKSGDTILTWYIPRLWYAGALEVRGFYLTENTNDVVDITLEDGGDSAEVLQLGGSLTNAVSDAEPFKIVLTSWSADGDINDYTAPTSPIDIKLTLSPDNPDSAVTAQAAVISAMPRVHPLSSIEVG